MKLNPHSSRVSAPCLVQLCFIVGLLWVAPALWADEDSLTLRVEDTRAHAEGVAVIAVRTYAPRPVGSGQLCLRVRKRNRSGRSMIADLELLEVRVFGQDVSSSSSFVPDTDGGEIIVTFASPMGVNRTDGPLFAAFLRLGPGLAVDSELDLELDLANTEVTDEQGEAIAVDLRPGTLRVLAQAAPLEIDAESETHTPGEFPIVTVSTQQGWSLSAGSLRVSVPEALANAQPTLATRHQYGSVNATLTKEASTVLRIDFDSPGKDFNEVPGAVFEIRFSKTLAVGTYPLAILINGTSVFDELSNAVPFITAGDQLVINTATLAASDFETGDLSEWSVAGKSWLLAE